MAASEMAPLARTGGLGDTLEALPVALRERGHDVTVVLPFFRSIREFPRLRVRPTNVTLPVAVGLKRVEAEILEATAPNGIQLFLVRRDEYFDRSGIYGIDGRPYDDTAERFIFFAKAVVGLVRQLRPAPDAVHLHDWQAAAAAVFFRHGGLGFPTVLTAHNVAYQGSFWAVDFSLMNLPPEMFGPAGVEFNGTVNLLKGGLLFADAVTTVSERYAQEIQTPEFGHGLDAVLREQRHKLSGILNGLDDKEWNPGQDKHLPRKYRAAAPAGKKVCRDALLEELGLAPGPAGPVFVMVTRLAEQKGLDLLLPLLDRLLADDVRLVVQGEGETRYERELTLAWLKHPERFAFRRDADEGFRHRIVAGGDCALFPSHYEPGGQAAMSALKYGTIPVARACGGLHQIIRDDDPATADGNGFLFFDYTPEALWDGIGRAKKAYAGRAGWQALGQRAMAADFSWARTAAAYDAVYRRLTGGG